MMKLFHLKNLCRGICLATVAGYVYLVTTEISSNFFADYDAVKLLTMASGLCAIAVVYIGRISSNDAVS